MNLFWKGFIETYNSVQFGQAVAAGLPIIILMFLFLGLVYYGINKK